MSDNVQVTPNKRVRENHDPSYDRLAEVKRRYDPTNLFHLNESIAPAAAS